MALAGLRVDADCVPRTGFGASLAGPTSSLRAGEFFHRHKGRHVVRAGVAGRPLERAEEFSTVPVLAFSGARVADPGLARAGGRIVVSSEPFARTGDRQFAQFLWCAEGLRVLEKRSRVALPTAAARSHHA